MKQKIEKQWKKSIRPKVGYSKRSSNLTKNWMDALRRKRSLKLLQSQMKVETLQPILQK